MKNRKLFPSLAQTNQTSENCSGYCDPACPYNCYYYYYLSPPPPLPVQDLSGDRSHYLSPYVIVAVSLLAGFFLIVSYYVIVSKYCARWLGSRRPPRDDSEFMDENRVDHPIWYIATVGLQQSIINSITVCRYNKDEGLVEGTDCSVCLNEFQDGETLRLLPKCNHAFHILCIDTWLRSHTNCPLCRAGIVLVTGNVPARIPLGQNSGDGDRIMENQPEDSENRVVTEDVGESGETEGKEGENLQGVVDRELVRRKRAVSMDSAGPAAAASPAGLRDSEKYSSSVDRWLHLSPVPMKRSSSCGERLSLSSRRNIATLKGTL